MEIQELFDHIRVYRESKLNVFKRKLNKFAILCKMGEELGEIMQVVNNDYWEKEKLDKERLSEEIVDLIFFLVDLCDYYNIKPDQIETIFRKKLAINYRRLDEFATEQK